ncbi:unnamed protein product, partial [Laminaria digitata]
SSSWISRLGSVLTIENAAEWVKHAVRQPDEVVDAFRNGSISGYDFLELVKDDGAALYHDLGIDKKF